MAMQLIIGALLIVITILIQGFGTTALLRLLFRRFADDSGDFFPEKALPAVILTALGLMLLHCLQILIWAVAYLYLTQVEPIDSLESAAYFSAITFTTLGYGDITLSTDQWRLLTGIEALNGVLLLGWSTALLYAVVHRGWRSYAEIRLRQGEK
jgi:voltage-gated potassium channel